MHAHSWDQDQQSTTQESYWTTLGTILTEYEGGRAKGEGTALEKFGGCWKTQIKAQNQEEGGQKESP